MLSSEDMERRMHEESKWWSPMEKGDSISGRFQGFNEGRNQKGDLQAQAVLSLESGKQKVLPSSKIINKALFTAKVQIGQVVTVIFDGEMDTGGRFKTKLYTITIG